MKEKEIHINGRIITLTDNELLAERKESNIYKVGDTAYKIYHKPDDYKKESDKKAAEERIETYRRKLPDIPPNLPKRIVTPDEIARDRFGKIIGFSMRFIEANRLSEYKQREFREEELDIKNTDAVNTIILPIFRDLHHSVSDVHEVNVVIGDFSDSNVLVKDKKAYLIDVDSFQFRGYQCDLFKEDFLDPKLMDIDAEDKIVKKLSVRYTPDSDWYAYNTILLHNLLFVHPYDGIYLPQHKTKKERLEDRNNIFDTKNVEYLDKNNLNNPLPLDRLPDELLQYFEDVFVRNIRGNFPAYLLDMRWTKCTQCGAEHARGKCPKCHGYTRKELNKPQQAVAARTIFQRDYGLIIASEYQKKQLRYVYYEEYLGYKREDGSLLLNKPFNDLDHFDIQGKNTYIKAYPLDSQLHLSGDKIRLINDPQEDGLKFLYKSDFLKQNIPHSSWSEGFNSGAIYLGLEGILSRMDKYGNVTSCDYRDLLEPKCSLWWWVGEEFGLICTNNSMGFKPEYVFDAHNLNIKHPVNFRRLEGNTTGASACYFDKDICWLLLPMRKDGNIVNYCMVINNKGEFLKGAIADADSNTWLGEIKGKCAVGNSLLTPTDAGILQVTLVGKELLSTIYPNTEDFVNYHVKLLRGKDNEIYAVKDREITKLEFEIKSDQEIVADSTVRSISEILETLHKVREDSSSDAERRKQDQKAEQRAKEEWEIRKAAEEKILREIERQLEPAIGQARKEREAKEAAEQARKERERKEAVVRIARRLVEVLEDKDRDDHVEDLAKLLAPHDTSKTNEIIRKFEKKGKYSSAAWIAVYLAPYDPVAASDVMRRNKDKIDIDSLSALAAALAPDNPQAAKDLMAEFMDKREREYALLLDIALHPYDSDLARQAIQVFERKNANDILKEIARTTAARNPAIAEEVLKRLEEKKAYGEIGLTPVFLAKYNPAAVEKMMRNLLEKQYDKYCFYLALDLAPYDSEAVAKTMKRFIDKDKYWAKFIAMALAPYKPQLVEEMKETATNDPASDRLHNKWIDVALDPTNSKLVDESMQLLTTDNWLRRLFQKKMVFHTYWIATALLGSLKK